MTAQASEREPSDERRLGLVGRKRRGENEAAEPAAEAGGQTEHRPTDAPASQPGLRAKLIDRWRIVASILLLVTGIALVMLGWYGAANTNILTEQIPYLISGGLLGLGLIIVAGVFAASASSERDARILHSQIADVLARAPSGRTVRVTKTSRAREHVFAVSGGRSFHLAGCPIVEGKDGVRELTPTAAASEGLAPCKLCAAD